MSRSKFRISLDYAMLDGEKACVPGYEDSSGGHIIFNSGKVSLRTIGPASSAFDELEQPYDHEKMITHVVEKIKEEIALGHQNGDSMLRSLIGNVLTQAKQHCDEHHKELREKHKNDKR